jgi:hypothetical protein
MDKQCRWNCRVQIGRDAVIPSRGGPTGYAEWATVYPESSSHTYVIDNLYVKKREEANATQFRPSLDAKNFTKFFKIPLYIESLDTYMKH